MSEFHREHYQLADGGAGIYCSESPNQNAMASFYAIASDLLTNDKPVYLSLLMSERQVRQIIENKHLFDLDLVNAAYLLLNHYNTLKIEYTD